MKSKKTLLIYAHYFVPDVASTGQILKELTDGMKDVFDITVICVVPSYMGVVEPGYKTQKFYREHMNGVDVLRIKVPEFQKGNTKSRIINIMSYFFGAMCATFLVGKQDYVFAISQPPILGGLLGVWGKWVKHAKYIYNIQDFNPEQIMAVGLNKNKFLMRLLMMLDKFSCKRSDLVITVGRDLVETLEKRFQKKKKPNCIMINNWIDEDEVFPMDMKNSGVQSFRAKYELEDAFVIMYSGNIGLYYDLENIIKVIRSFPSGTTTRCGRKVVFAFVGAGTIRDKIKEYVQNNQMSNVVFLPYQKKEELVYSLNVADVHWCVNAKGIKGVSCPSKFYGIVACQKPVLGVLEEDSEIGYLIRETNCGLCSKPGDYESIKKNIQWFIDHDGSEELFQMGYRGRDYLEKNLRKNDSIQKYKKAILEIGQ